MPSSHASSQQKKNKDGKKDSPFRLSKESSFYQRRTEDSAIFQISPNEMERIRYKQEAQHVKMKELMSRLYTKT